MSRPPRLCMVVDLSENLLHVAGVCTDEPEFCARFHSRINSGFTPTAA